MKEVKNYVRGQWRLVGSRNKSSRRRQARKTEGKKGDAIKMKRYGHIIEEIIDEANMNESFDYVMRGRKRKKSRAGRYIIRHRSEVISKLQERIGDGSYTVSGFRTYTISERGKEREIQSIPLTDRIALNAIMRVVERYLNRRFIADSAASIKGRGMHYLLKRMVKDMMRDKDGTRYVYKCDVRKFYQSIDQTLMTELLRRVFKDKKLTAILQRCVCMLPDGMSIGLRTSQALGNLYLDHCLDHIIKEKLEVKYYRRYCDDEVIQSYSYRKLTMLRCMIHECMNRANLSIKGNEQMFCVCERPIDFLGFQVFGNGRIKVRKHIKQRFARRWGRTKSKKRRVELAGSFYGIAKHAQSKHLFKKITGISMRSFSDFGLSYVAADGKKRFDCNSYPLGELQNETIVVLDYETGVKTKEGDGRYVVHFKFPTTEKEGKFFTNSEELKQMLDKVSEIEDGFPFETVIKRISFGNNRYKYSFT